MLLGPEEFVFPDFLVPDKAVMIVFSMQALAVITGVGIVLWAMFAFPVNGQGRAVMIAVCFQTRAASGMSAASRGGCYGVLEGRRRSRRTALEAGVEAGRERKHGSATAFK